jgi:hypothetical protein
MKLKFCVACGSTDDLQHHHLVTRTEGRPRFDDERNLITLCHPCHAILHERKINGVYNTGKRIAAGLAAARKRGVKPGHKSHTELRPEVVALAKSLRRQKPKGGQMSLRTIAAVLAAQGHLNEHDKPFNPYSIKSMLEGDAP